MNNELPFNGFMQQIREPLESADAVSFKRIKRLIQDNPQAMSQPFAFLIRNLADKIFTEDAALEHWTRILAHKTGLEAKLGRLVNIKTAAVDYFCLLEEDKPRRRTAATPAKSPDKTAQTEEWIGRMYTPGYHLERLKDEMMRSKRYNHALSVIMLDLDRFHEIDEGLAEDVRDAALKVIAKIIRSTVRGVDIIARCSGDVFIIILPSTNKREALELAERLRNRIFERTKPIEAFPGGVTATLSVGQCAKDDSAQDFVKRLETVLTGGKKMKANSVYSL